MRVVIQRVSSGSVTVEGREIESIGKGLFILLGIEQNDTIHDVEWLCQKISKLRVFNDAAGVMNLSLPEIGGELLVVSQFTLFASTRKGNRPSYIRAARPEIAIPLYESFLDQIQQLTRIRPKRGIFGADMKVALINDGPVTIIMDTVLKE